MEQIFYSEFEYYCYKSCYLNVLRYYHVKHPEFYIDYSLDWTFIKDNKEKWGYTFNTGNLNSDFLYPFNQELHCINKNMISKEQIWELNKRDLQNDIPVIVTVDVFYLKYTPYFHKKHSIHSLILAGYDKKEEKVYIIDWYHSWYFKGEISREELDIARNSMNESDGILSGIPINYTSYTISKSVFYMDGLELIKQSVQDNQNKYYLGTCGPKRYKGYYAINEIARLLEQNMNLKKEDRAGFLEDLYEKLYFVHSRKKIFNWFLGRIQEEYSMISVNCTQKKLNETMALWKKLLSLIIKCRMTNKDEVYEKVIMLVQQIILEEKQFYYSLYELNKKIKLI